MQSGHGSSPRWGLLATLAIHGLLWGGWMVAARHERPVATPASGPVLHVRLVAPPRSPSAAPVPAQDATAGASAPSTPPDQRDAIHYFYPEEVDRELLPRLDPTAELVIDLPHPVVLHLLVDARGRVNTVMLEENDLEPALQERLRSAFMGMTFLPARRGGQDVAARMRIEVAATGAPEREAAVP